MEIVLIRHGQPEWVRGGLNIDNPPLTDLGRRQAEAMAEYLRDEEFDEVLCSPLRRARETAAPLFRALGRPETIDPWLEEIRNPIWHGTPEEKSAEAYREERARRSHDRWAGLEGGENVRDFVDRIHLGCSLFLAERGVNRIEAELAMWEVKIPDLRIAIVAHAGTNSVVICQLLGLAPTPWEWDRFVIGHASVSRLRTLEMGDGHSFSLTRLSDNEFLSRDDRTV
ncbi:MAG: histidine phosphatase family protein [Ilumatobacteraceae bacterium]